MKTGIKVLSTTALVLGAVAVTGGSETKAATTGTVGDFKYRIEADENGADAEIVAYNGTAADVTIPQTIEDNGKIYHVTCVGLEGNTYVQKLTIPEGVSDLDSSAFKGCTNLKEVNLPASLNYVDTAFVDSSVETINVAAGSKIYASDNGNLYKADKKTLVVYAPGKTETSFTVPEGTTGLYSNAFDTCKNLQSVVLPTSMAILNSDSFADCPNLTDVQIPDGVKEIRRNAFSGCTNLKTITLPKTVTNVSSAAFADSVENINVNSANKNYSSVKGNLYDKKQTKLLRYAPGKKTASYVMPKTVKTVIDVAFKDATELKNIVVNDKVTSVKSVQFDNTVKTVTILNKKCKMGSKNAIAKKTVVYGYANSTASKYAKKNKKTFKAFKAPNAVKTTTAEGKSKSVVVKWTADKKNTKGYTVQYSTSKKFTAKTTKSVTAKKTSQTIKGLKKNQTYYVKVSAYNTVKVAGNKLNVTSDAGKTVAVKAK